MPEWRNLPLPAGRLVDTLDMYYVYALQSLKRSYIYVGLTNNIERRFGEHNLGKNRTTKPYRPYRLIFTEKFVTRPQAREREKYLKSGTGKEFLKKLQL